MGKYGIGLAGLTLLLSGCSFMPWTYEPPHVEAPKAIAVAPLPVREKPLQDVKPQVFDSTVLISENWWTTLKHQGLTDLIESSLKRHPSIESAEALIRAAEADLAAMAGETLYPQVGISASAARAHTNSASIGGKFPFGGSFNVLNTALNVSYTPDLFGAFATSLEGLGARVDMQSEALAAVRLNLASSIASAAIREAALRVQRDQIEALAHAEESLLELTEARLKLGAATENERLSALLALEATRALLPDIDKSIAQNRHLLLSLSGQTDSIEALPLFYLRDFELPQKLPQVIPSELLQARPDIRSAEAAMRAANAAVGVADANLYPSLSLTGSLGGGANRVGDLLTQNASLWNFGAGIVAPVLNGGSLKAKKASAEASYQQVRAQYRDTVIQAMQSVADVLAAIETDAATLDRQKTVVHDQNKTLRLAEAQLKLGAGTRQQILMNQIQVLQAEVNLTGPEANRLIDTVMLYQVLGGRRPPSISDSSKTGSSL